MELSNPFEQPGKFYRANLHTHTTVSDGDSPVVERARQYKEAGYDVLAITDHRATNDVSGLSDDNFLVISGMETHPDCPGGYNIYHIVCLDVPHPLVIPEGTEANTHVKMVKDAGGEVIFAHPYWCGHNINQIMDINDFIAVEVFNTTCTGIGKGYSSVHWDDVLDTGRVVGAVAVDDVHGTHDRFQGWTMIKSTELSVKGIMAALKSGSYYSSCGPVIEDFRRVGDRLVVKSSPVKEIHFMGRRASGCRVCSSNGELMTEAELTIYEGLGYVRAEVIDAEGRHAWTNPIVLEEYWK
jgi:hypothetical protein